jgi:magnesium transporter
MAENESRKTRTQLDDARKVLEKDKRKGLRRILRSMHPAKVASFLESLSPAQAASAWEQVDPEVEDQVLAHLDERLRAILTRDADTDGLRDALEKEGPTRLRDVRDAVNSGRLKRLRRILKDMHPAKIAGLLESLPPDERLVLWDMAPTKLTGRVLVHLHEEVRTRLALETDTDDLIAAAQGLALDDLVDLIQGLPEAKGQELMQAMDLQKRQRLEAMLSYPEDTAGGLMDTDQITVRANVTLGTVLRYLRLLEDLPNNTDKVMVVDRSERYQGVLHLRRLVTNQPERRVKEIMDAEFPALPASMSSKEVARRFEDFDLTSAPVVDDENRLLGRITVDNVVDVIRDESEHSLMSMAGLDEEADMFGPVATSARRRAVWLGINLITAFMAAWVIGLFEGTLQKVVALAVLMPVVASMGGIAGSQTLTLVIRGLALGYVERSNARLLLLKELGIGVLNGLIWAVVVAALAIVWFGDWEIGGVIAVAILLNLLCAALAGVAIPLLLRRMGIDPALAGSVVLTTVTDIVGFFAFLGLGTLLLL